MDLLQLQVANLCRDQLEHLHLALKDQHKEQVLQLQFQEEALAAHQEDQVPAAAWVVHLQVVLVVPARKEAALQEAVSEVQVLAEVQALPQGQAAKEVLLARALEMEEALREDRAQDQDRAMGGALLRQLLQHQQVLALH